MREKEKNDKGKGCTLLLVGIRVGEAGRLACLAAKQSVQVGASLVRLTLATSVFQEIKKKNKQKLYRSKSVALRAELLENSGSLLCRHFDELHVMSTR